MCLGCQSLHAGLSLESGGLKKGVARRAGQLHSAERSIAQNREGSVTIETQHQVCQSSEAAEDQIPDQPSVRDAGHGTRRLVAPVEGEDLCRVSPSNRQRIGAFGGFGLQKLSY